MRCKNPDNGRCGFDYCDLRLGLATQSRAIANNNGKKVFENYLLKLLQYFKILFFPKP